MSLPAWLVFFERTFPSANMCLVLGERPLLLDSGFGSDFAETIALIETAGVAPHHLHRVVNTHYHSDHVGGNHGFQTRYTIPIATHHTEAELINQRDVAACSAEWLRQPIEPYTVDEMLVEGDVLDTGQVALEVVATPGHTLGHISFYARRDQVLILGDAVHSDDVSWVNLFREGTGALQRTMHTLEKLLTLPVKVAVSGHGGIHHAPHQAMTAALYRYERWLDDPPKAAWHAMKRIFSYALMLHDGLPRATLHAYLLESPWFRDYSEVYMQCAPAEFIAPFLAEMVRSGAAAWHNDTLMAQTPYNPPSTTWYPSRLMPRAWDKTS